MDFDLMFGVFLFKMAIKIEKDDFMKMSVSPTTKHSFVWFWDMLLEAKIDRKTHSKTEWLLQNMFDAFCSMLKLILNHF